MAVIHRSVQKMKIPLPITLSAWCFLCLSSLGEEPAKEFEYHLEPIYPFDHEGYDQAVFRSLIDDRKPAFWMLVKPSFSPEYGLLAVAPPIRNGDPDPFGGPAGVTGYNWYIEAAVAEEQIYRHKELGGGRLEMDIKVTDKVERHRVEIPASLADAIGRAWDHVLRQTRYHEDANTGLDGVIVQFGSGYRTGEVWSPEKGTPALLSELGHLLFEMVTATEDEKRELEKKCETQARKIIEEASAPKQGDAVADQE